MRQARHRDREHRHHRASARTINLVIRQLGEVHEDDPFVVICANNVDEFLDRLCDIVGVPSVGRRWS
jgi:hypothetical protein